jgi:chromosome segregation ATPase
MSDDLVKQAIAELGDIVRCRCHPAYKDRKLHDPDCNCDSAEALKVVADRIEELEAQLEAIEEDGTKSLNALPDCLMKLAPALVKIDELEAKLAQAVEALELADAAMSGANMNMRAVERKVKTAIAAIKGEK